MKKTLIAVAALAATAAMADMKITGTYDATFSRMTTNTGASGAPDIVNSGYRTLDGLGTTGIKFAVNDDLGDGLKAEAMFEHNFGGGNAGAGGTSTAGEWFAGISGDFGRVRVGAPNTVTLGVQIMGDAGFTTKPGGRVSATGAATHGTAVTRLYNSVQYQSPVVGGAVINATYKAANTDDGDTTTPTIMDIGAVWTDGKAITVGVARYSESEVKSGTLADEKSLLTLGAKVNLASMAGVPLTVGANYHSQEQGDATNVGFRAGVDFALSDALTLSGTFQSVTIDTGAAETDVSEFAVGAQYKLAKQATTYARFLSGENGDATASGFLAGLMVTF